MTGDGVVAVENGVDIRRTVAVVNTIGETMMLTRTRMVVITIAATVVAVEKSIDEATVSATVMTTVIRSQKNAVAAVVAMIANAATTGTGEVSREIGLPVKALEVIIPTKTEMYAQQ